MGEETRAAAGGTGTAGSIRRDRSGARSPAAGGRRGTAGGGSFSLSSMGLPDHASALLATVWNPTAAGKSGAGQAAVDGACRRSGVDRRRQPLSHLPQLPCSPATSSSSGHLHRRRSARSLPPPPLRRHPPLDGRRRGDEIIASMVRSLSAAARSGKGIAGCGTCAGRRSLAATAHG